MAIIFTSPQKRQRIFFRIITMLLILLLFVISLIIFPPQFKNKIQNIATKGDFNAPDIKINFGIIDSRRFKDLEPFLGIQTEFNYVANDQSGKQVTGSVLAVAKDDAKIILEEMGLEVSSLEESNIGRNEPFAPYY